MSLHYLTAPKSVTAWGTKYSDAGALQESFIQTTTVVLFVCLEIGSLCVAEAAWELAL